MKSFKVTTPTNLKDFTDSVYPQGSFYYSALIRSGDIRVNGAKVRASVPLKEGDEVTYYTTPSMEAKPSHRVIYADERLVAVDKFSGVSTEALACELSLIPVHRLDRNTSGLIMTAKNNKTHEYLAEQIKERRFSKKYIAVTKGVIEQDEFIINSPIGRNPKQPHKMEVNKDGKESITGVKVLERFKDASLVELDLITGRTHQIRVHLSSIGHPVYNDTLYGFGKMKIKTEEQVLEAYKLEFTKPFSNEVIKLEIPPDEKFEKVLRALRGE